MFATHKDANMSTPVVNPEQFSISVNLTAYGALQWSAFVWEDCQPNETFLCATSIFLLVNQTNSETTVTFKIIASPVSDAGSVGYMP